MKDIKEIYGSWCLLAGAAEGLGEAWSIALAERGMNVIMVDHQQDLMHALADRLEQSMGSAPTGYTSTLRKKTA